MALQLFKGDNPKGPSHLEFKTWYHPEVCHYLLQLVDNNACCVPVVFLDAGYGDNTTTFQDQLEALILLANKLDSPAVFIAKEPGAESHFISGLLKANQLVLINPLGMTTHQDCYKTLAKLQKANILNTIWLSSTALQRSDYEEALVSCGPISIELMMHILKRWSSDNLNAFWAELKSNESTRHENTGVQYIELSIEALLPESLKGLPNVSTKKGYQQQVNQIRQAHYQLLSNEAEQLAAEKGISIETYLQQIKEEAPSQVLFNALVTKHSNVLNLDKLAAYDLLKETLNKELQKSRSLLTADSIFNPQQLYSTNQFSVASDLTQSKAGIQSNSKQLLEPETIIPEVISPPKETAPSVSINIASNNTLEAGSSIHTRDIYAGGTHHHFNSSEPFTANEINAFRDKLNAHYQSEQYTRIQLLGDEEQSPMQLKDIFVNLVIVKEQQQKEREQKTVGETDPTTVKAEGRCLGLLNTQEDIREDKSPIALSDLFKLRKVLVPTKENSKPTTSEFSKKLLLLGRAGIGKSTLCRYLAYQWAKGELLSEFSWVFHIDLKRLANDLPKEHSINKTLAQLLHHYHWRYLDMTETQAELLWQSIQTKKEPILFLLDGYDEIAHLQYPLVEQMLLSQPYYLLTSRPYAIRSKRKDVDEVLENIGLLPPDIEKYIDKYFTHRSPNKKAKQQLNIWLNKQTSVRSMCAIPIYLELLCNIWITDRKDIQQAQDHLGITDLYNLLVERLLKRMLSKMDPSNLKGYADMDKVAFYQEPDVIIVRSYLAKLAFDGLNHNEGRLLISGQLFVEIREFIQNQLTNLVNEQPQQLELITPDNFNWHRHKKVWKQRAALPNLHEHLLKGGFLKNIGDSGDISKNNYSFLHLSFQEYFAALYYVTHNLKAHHDFILKYKNQYSYDSVWPFVSGLLTNDISMLKIFLDLLIEKSQDIFGKHHLLLLIKCLAACSSRANSLNDIAALNLVMRKLRKVFDTFLPSAVFGTSHFLHFQLMYNPDFFRYQQVQEYFLEKIKQNKMVRLNPSTSLGEQSKKCLLSYLAQMYDFLPKLLQETIEEGFCDEDLWVGHSILLHFPQKNIFPKRAEAWFLRCLKEDSCQIHTLPRLAEFLQADNNFKTTIIKLIANEGLSLHAIKRILWSLQETNHNQVPSNIWDQFKNILTQGSCKHRLMNLKITSPALKWIGAIDIISELKFKSGEIIELLFRGLKHEDETVKWKCIDTISNFNGFNSQSISMSISILTNFLVTKNEMLIMIALTSLLKLNRKPSGMKNWLMSILSKKEDDFSVTDSIGYLRSEALLSLVEYEKELTENDFEKLLQINFIFINDKVYTGLIFKNLITLLKVTNRKSSKNSESILRLLAIIYQNNLESKYSPYDVDSVANNLIVLYMSITPKDMIYVWNFFLLIEIFKEQSSISLSGITLLELDKYFNNKEFIQYIHNKILQNSNDCAVAIQSLNIFKEKPDTFISDLVDNFENFSSNSQIEASIILVNNKFYEPRFIEVLINGIKQAEDNFLIILNSLKQALKEGLSTKLFLSKILAVPRDSHGNVNLEIIKKEIIKIKPLLLLNGEIIILLFILITDFRREPNFHVYIIGILVDIFNFFCEEKCDIERDMILDQLKMFVKYKNTPISSFSALALIKMDFKEPEIIDELLNIFKFSQEVELLSEAFNCLCCLDFSRHLSKIMSIFPELIQFLKLKSIHILDEINGMLAKTPPQSIIEQYMCDKKTAWLFLIANELKKHHYALYLDNDNIYFSFSSNVNESNINYSAPLDKQQQEILKGIDIFENVLFNFEENVLREFHLNLGLQYDNFLEEKIRDSLSNFLKRVADYSSIDYNDILIKRDELPITTTRNSSTFAPVLHAYPLNENSTRALEAGQRSTDDVNLPPVDTGSSQHPSSFRSQN